MGGRRYHRGRRRGLARATAMAAIDELRKRGVSKIQLEVMERNEPALALWRTLGFNKVSDRLVLANGHRR